MAEGVVFINMKDLSQDCVHSCDEETEIALETTFMKMNTQRRSLQESRKGRKRLAVHAEKKVVTKLKRVMSQKPLES